MPTQTFRTSLSEEARINKSNNLFDSLNNDILDSYLDDEISEREMKNILRWTEKMRVTIANRKS